MRERTERPGSVSSCRLMALVRKETVQTLRDPSSLLIAGLMPLLMLFLFGYGLNLDTGTTRIAVVVEDSGAAAQDVVAAIAGSPYLRITYMGDRGTAARLLDRGDVGGFVVVPDGFSRTVIRGGLGEVQAVTDGTEPNTAAFVSAYVSGAIGVWRTQRDRQDGDPAPGGIATDPRYWFNPATVSRNSLVPGSIAVVMTVVGALLTSLVVAREWERGTMEALLVDFR